LSIGFLGAVTSEETARQADLSGSRSELSVAAVTV